MVIHTTTGLAMAAVCLVTIAMVPARHAAAQGHTVTVKHTPMNNPSDVSEPSSAGRT
jgi:hypothetical protein